MKVGLPETDLDRVLAALAGVQRRTILESLATSDQSVEALSSLVSSSTWNTLKHVRILEDAGLLVTQKVGRARICRLRPEGLGVVTQWTTDLKGFWSSNIRRLEAHLAEND